MPILSRRASEFLSISGIVFAVAAQGCNLSSGTNPFTGSGAAPGAGGASGGQGGAAGGNVNEIPTCGNGNVDPSEECDPAVVDDGDEYRDCGGDCKAEFRSFRINEINCDTTSGNARCFIEIVGASGASFNGCWLQWDYWNDDGTAKGVLQLDNLNTSTPLDGDNASGPGYLVIKSHDDIDIDPGASFTTCTAIKDLKSARGLLTLACDPNEPTWKKVCVANNNASMIDVCSPEEIWRPSMPWLWDGQSISRLPNGIDTNNNAADFDLAATTPGASNGARH